jgi:uncharacterized protein
MKKIMLSFYSLLIIYTISAQQKEPLNIAGSWMGKISVQGTQLKLIFHFKAEDGKIASTIDSPDQAVKGIQVQDVLLKNDSLIVNVPVISGQYKAIFNSDTMATGQWNQMGMSLPLTITKQKPEVVKPSVDRSHALYDALEVKFTNEKANVTLAGTLTVPKNTTNYPVAILVSGSGPQNRDEELMGQKPFLRIADYLSSHGVAVLRYDDRGTAESTGNFQTATSYDFASDAEAAILFLLNRKDINTSKIGIIGHSEGGMIAPLIASSNKKVSFIILLAGPGITGENIILTQNEAILKASGTNPDTIALISTLNKQTMEVIKTEPDNKKAYENIKEIVLKSSLSENAKPIMMKKIVPLFSPWFKSFITFDPKTYLSKVSCPVLALNGSLDLQVLSKINLNAIDSTLKNSGHKHYTIKELDGYNHLFQQTKTGLMNEYGDLQNPVMNDDVLKIIASWLSKI